jgi:hypothetical protein
MATSIGFDRDYPHHFDHEIESDSEDELCNDCGRIIGDDTCVCVLKARSRKATNNLVEQVAIEMDLFEIFNQAFKVDFKLT